MRTLFFSMLLVALSIPTTAAEHRCGHQVLNEITPWDARPWTGPVKGGRGFPSVGDQRDFWVYDLSVMPPKNVTVAATCRAVGTRSAVWVSDDEWGGEVTQADLDSILLGLETSTPRTADAGLIQGDIDLFGAPPYFAEGDPDLSILIYALQGYKGYLFDGYFRAEDLSPFNPACQNNPSLYCSNELGMIHINANKPGSDYMVGVIAHEYQHMIHFALDPYEEVWINEAMSELAMVWLGYEDPGNLGFFCDNPDAPLVVMDYVDYGAVLLFGAYLEERIGPEGITAFVADTLTGITGLEGHLPAGATWESLFGQWVAANVLDAPAAADGEFGYALVEVPEFAVEPLGTVPVDTQVTIPAYAGGYYTLDATAVPFDETLTVTFDPIGSDSMGHALLPGTVQVVHLPAGEEVVLPSEMTDPALRLTASNPGDAPVQVRFTIDSVYITEPEPQPEAGPEPEADVVIGPEPDTSGPAEDTIAAQDTAGENEGGGGSGGGCTRSASSTAGPLALLLGFGVAAFAFRTRRREDP